MTIDSLAERPRRYTGWIKAWPASATRHEKLAINYLAMLRLVLIERRVRLLDGQTEPSHQKRQRGLASPGSVDFSSSNQ